ncbi:P-loop containing nucleoside triphosphate hydrolase protein [Gorgonomyces haynaldii]|nr:P-loop containing nucleoside triphosphate hydrolase protein [Gorgonomyces haynaldii]
MELPPARKRKQVKSNVFNYVTVGWLTPVMLQGAKHTLRDDELLNLKDTDTAKHLAMITKPFWTDYYNHLEGNPRKPGLHKIFFKNYTGTFLLAFLNRALSVGCQLSFPIFMQQILYYLLFYVKPIPDVAKPTLLIDNGYLLVFVLFLLQALSSVFNQTAQQMFNSLQININTILISAIYEKSLRLSQKASREFTQGQILNLINVDTEKISTVLLSLAGFVVSPIQIGVAVKLLSDLIGVSVWGGAGSLFVILMLQMLAVNPLLKAQKGFLKMGDKRLKLLREIFYGMKVIKFRALEQFFSDRVTQVRWEQLGFLKFYYVAHLFFIGLIEIAPISMPTIAFIVYALLNGDIRPDIIFPALTLFNGLFETILIIPQATSSIAVGYVSWKRVVQFLLAEEAPGLSIESNVLEENAIVFEGTEYKWERVVSEQSTEDKQKPDNPEKKSDKNEKKIDKNEKKIDKNEIELERQESDATQVSDQFSLNNLDLKIKKGSKIAVVGPVGSGKSSFLSAVIGEMPLQSGKLHRYGTLAYCSQQPWILTETIQGNIVFNNTLEEDRLSTILNAVGLDNDLKMFPAGRMTEIGEKGVNLSGGQKARVALARAMYQDRDIYLLDDPISALDAQVGRQVFDNAIKGYLKDKTVILVTHQLHLLPEMDHIVVLDHGSIGEQGTFEELINKKGILQDMMQHYSIDKKEDKKEEKKEQALVEDDQTGKGAIITAEDQEQGAVQLGVYWNYVTACGGWPFLIVLSVSSTVYAVIQVISNLWLTWWSIDKYSLTTRQYLLGYGLLAVAQFLSIMCLLSVLLVGGYNAAKVYHSKALQSLLRAPMGFFDSQPIGRILNRMSKDIESIDQRMWLLCYLALLSVAALLGTGGLLIYTDPIMTALIVPLLIIYAYMIVFYQRSNREFKRYESTYRSPLYAHVSETLSGLATVKAYKVETQFLARLRMLMDESNVPTYMRLSSSIWIGIRMEVLSTTLTLLLGCLGISSAIDPSIIGVAFTYSLGITGLFSMLLRSTTQLESELNSIERLTKYISHLDQEQSPKNDDDPEESVWPSEGKIDFNQISLSYPSRPDTLILKNLTVSIKAGEKVGVIGRTGSGKSTLMTALFRIVELQSGSIVIDGRDIRKLGLNTLRSRMQIIPQEPVLFTGTIRNNLDVEGKFSDDDIWKVLEQIGLHEYVSSLNEKLDSPVSENGENLSVGQRQLICLGRAILQKPKILIMDEATASVDGAADKMIQESIKTQFKHTTVLSIAHRLNTIADFDRVLVLQDGELAEYDAPHILLSNPKSLFSALADATGQANSQLIRDIAKEKYSQ